MAPRKSEMDRRWGFLRPWCLAVKDLITYKRVDREWEFWSDEKYFLEVKLPMRCGMTEDANGDEYEYGLDEWTGETEFRAKFKKVREALALLAAVAHVDQAAWKYLLSNYCGVKLGGSKWDARWARNIPAEYYLILDQDQDWRTCFEDHVGFDLVLFCGVDHRTTPTKEYVNALAKIAALDTNLKADDGPGVDVVIPVRCFYPCHGISSDGGPKIMKNVLVSEQTIQELWQRLEKQPVPQGELRCTFVLKPMIADLEGMTEWPKMAKRFGKLISKGMRFSEVKTTAQWGSRRIGDDSEATEVFGKVMASLFSSTRRAREINCCSELAVDTGDSTSLQIDTVVMKCHPELETEDVQAMGSAMVVNQTTKNLAMLLAFPGLERVSSEEWWAWIAYSFFSKRARACSALESLALARIKTLSEEDVESFAAILDSDHPEEELFGLPRGEVDDRDATLNVNAPIQWEFDDDDEPREDSTPLTFPTPVGGIRTISDDGNSDWVNVIVPGFGRCRVQRRDLVFSDAGAVEENPRPLLSLTLSFEKFETIFTDGLAYFLSLVGPLLKSLTLDVPHLELGEEEILDLCPNLEKLAICGRPDVEFDVSGFTLDEDCGGEHDIDWSSIDTISRALSDMSNPFVQRVRKLRVYPSLNARSSAREAEALQDMLTKNRSVEYLELGADEEAFVDLIRKHHNTRIDRSITLPIASKAAFLSVISANHLPADGGKTQSCGLSSLGQIDGHALSLIFGFAGTPVLREVHLQQDYGEELEDLDEETAQARHPNTCTWVIAKGKDVIHYALYFNFLYFDTLFTKADLARKFMDALTLWRPANSYFGFLGIGGLKLLQHRGIRPGGPSPFVEESFIRMERFSESQMSNFFTDIDHRYAFTRSLRTGIAAYSSGAPGVFGSLVRFTIDREKWLLEWFEWERWFRLEAFREYLEHYKPTYLQVQSKLQTLDGMQWDALKYVLENDGELTNRHVEHFCGRFNRGIHDSRLVDSLLAMGIMMENYFVRLSCASNLIKEMCVAALPARATFEVVPANDPLRHMNPHAISTHLERKPRGFSSLLVLYHALYPSMRDVLKNGPQPNGIVTDTQLSPSPTFVNVVVMNGSTFAYQLAFNLLRRSEVVAAAKQAKQLKERLKVDRVVVVNFASSRQFFAEICHTKKFPDVEIVHACFPDACDQFDIEYRGRDQHADKFSQKQEPADFAKIEKGKMKSCQLQRGRSLAVLHTKTKVEVSHQVSLSNLQDPREVKP